MPQHRRIDVARPERGVVPEYFCARTQAGTRSGATQCSGYSLVMERVHRPEKTMMVRA